MTLKEMRREIGLSQTQMAIKLGMSTQNYVKYERGEYVNMAEDIKNKIRTILGDSSYEYERGV